MKLSSILTVSCLTILMLVAGPLMAQKGKTSDSDAWKSNQIQLNQSVYKTAMKYGDFTQARSAVYNLIELGNDTYKDTLAALYFTTGLYSNTVIVGREIIEADPKNENVLSLIAVSEMNLGMVKESLDHYEDLYKLTPDVFYLYQIASLQFSMERLGECRGTIDRIVADPKSKETTIQIAYDEKTEPQKVPIAAAALNMRGFMEMQINKDEEAKASFEQALAVYPDFRLAQGNLNALNNKATQPASNQPNPNGGK